jgi:tryptophanyl-tRNA synthetase
MLISVPRLQRVPTLKEVVRDLQLESASLGLLSYPVLQAADITCVRAHLVPVGKDQASHLEVTREIARRFNELYGEVFPIPETLIGEVPTLVGTDGTAKMSKSLGNAIMLADPPEEVRQKVMRMYTDPNRIRADIPGRVEGNPVFQYHDAFNDDRAEVDDLKERYRTGRVGDVEVKRKLNDALEKFLEPIRERRAAYESKPGLVDEIVVEGSRKARREAQETIKLAREAMGLSYFLAERHLAEAAS